MDAAVVVVFCLVYVGMMLGRLPGLALDRTGVALLGAIVLVACGKLSPNEAWDAVDVPTIGLLLGLMVVSAQFRLGGFYTWFTQRLEAADGSPPALLAMVVAASGLLSALLCNDIICLAIAPVLVDGCARRRLDPVPYLLGLACAANVGSAGTLIGNPQNMLIGQVLQLRFDVYLWQASVPTVAGLAAVWLVVVWRYRGRWEKETPLPDLPLPPLNRWQSFKGVAVLLVLVGLFLAGRWPREVLALGAAGVLLTSRRMASRAMLQLVDWQLLVLFSGLFVVNHSLEQSGGLEQLVSWLRAMGVDLEQPASLFVSSAVLSNLVSNVPATMLLLPSATHPLAGPTLALSSTLAGNLLIVGSIANMIVVDQAGRLGVTITWRDHARIGIPVTLLTLAIAGVWLAVLA